MTSPSDRYVALTESKQKTDPATIDATFDQLSPVSPSNLIGSWNGGFIDAGHPFAETLHEIKWIGKDFISTDNVDPVIVDKDGKRSSWGEWGMASLREVKYRDRVSTAMIYDDRPVIDYFRYVNDNMVAGVMEGKRFNSGIFHFYLTR